MKRMTYKSFLEILPKGGWEFEDGTDVRHKRVCDDGGVGCCPISYVFKKVTGSVPSNSCFTTQGVAVGLTEEQSMRIACAADKDFLSDPRAKTLRKRLLKACGLKESEE